jgi:GxxExxY protein
LDIESVGQSIVNSAIQVHRALGPGLLESVYQKCLAYELESQDLRVICEVPIPVRYGPITIDVGFKADLIAENLVIVENKTVTSLAPIHDAQLLTYLKITGLKLGYLLNWNVVLMKNGIKRMVNNL